LIPTASPLILIGPEMTELIIIRIVRTQRNLTPRFRLDASKIKSCSHFGRKIKDNTPTNWTNFLAFMGFEGTIEEKCTKTI